MFFKANIQKKKDIAGIVSGTQGSVKHTGNKGITPELKLHCVKVSTLVLSLLRLAVNFSILLKLNYLNY